MPRTRSLAWSELKLGVVTIIALVITGVTIVMFTGSRGFWWQQYGLKARFVDVAGLKPGSPVRIAGIEKGTVRDITFVGEQVDVLLSVNRDVRDKITSNSTATMGSISLLGESSVDITPSGRGAPIPEWGYVPQGRTAAQIADIANKADQGIEQLAGLIRDARGGKGTLGKLMTDDQLYTELHRFVTTASDLTEGIKQGRGSIGRLLSDRQAADALSASLANIETMTRQLNAGEGSLGKLLKDDTFSRSLSSATGNLDALVTRLNSGQGTAGKLVTDPALFNKLNSVTDRLDQLVTRLNDGEGTAGQLLKDTQLYENMTKATSELVALIGAIERDPRKYLNVKVSIF
jgi:phospholipid/cholesterol/gamma-HCH transport system substrate-binding protein